MDQDTSRGPCEAPWIYAMSELRSAQHSIELLRGRIDGVEALRDVRELREGLDNITSRIGRFEESVNMNHVNESLRRITRLEECISQVAASLIECHTRVNHCETDCQNLENRMRTQGCLHDLSEQESSDEIHRMVDGAPGPRRAVPKRRLVAQARVPLRGLVPWFAQLR